MIKKVAHIMTFDYSNYVFCLLCCQAQMRIITFDYSNYIFCQLLRSVVLDEEIYYRLSLSSTARTSFHIIRHG